MKRGVSQAGGLPLEFPVMSLGEYNMRPTTMMYRNLMSMDVEESIRANPLDGVVLLAGCDKTTPAMLMGAISADVPAIMVTGGPQLKANWRGEELGTCTDCRRYQQELRAGRITEDDWADLQGAIIASPGQLRCHGHCVDHGGDSRNAGNRAARQRGHTRGGLAPHRAWGAGRALHSRPGPARGAPVPLRHPAVDSQRHPGAPRTGRLHQCRRTPHSHRRARGNRPRPGPVRRAVEVDAVPAGPEAVGAVPDGGTSSTPGASPPC